MALDPEIAAELDAEAEPLRELPLARFREEVERAMLDTEGPGPFIDHVEEIVAPSVSEVPCTIYRPEGLDRPGPALLFIHGGGWVIGSRASHDPMCRAIATLANVAVISPEYRRAPEARFPQAVEDVSDIARWLISEAPSLGLERKRIGVGGDSAGGNLAAVVARRARDEGLDLAHQLLIYPVTDARQATRSYEAFGTGFGLTAADMAWFWDQYLGPTQDGLEPDASPLRAPDLRGMAPATVITAEYDPLRDEGEAYADRLVEAGVATTRLRALGMPHAFLNYLGCSMAVRSLYTIVAAAVRAGLSPAPGGQWRHPPTLQPSTIPRTVTTFGIAAVSPHEQPT